MKKFLEFSTLLSLLILNDKSVLCLSEGGKNSENCGGTFSDYQYKITSPNYPSEYPENQDCIYFLRGSRVARCEQEFHLKFLDFDLRPSKNCEKDFLQIGERNIFCGSTKGERIFKGENNNLKIRFHSAEGKGAGGFSILVTTLPCLNFKGRINANNTAQEPWKIVANGNPEVVRKFIPEGETDRKNPVFSIVPSDLEKSLVYSNRNQFEVETLSPLYRPQVTSPWENKQGEFFDQQSNQNNSSSQDNKNFKSTTYLFLPPGNSKEISQFGNPENPVIPPSMEFSPPVRKNTFFRPIFQDGKQSPFEREQSDDFYAQSVDQNGEIITKEANCNQNPKGGLSNAGNKQENFPDRNFQINSEEGGTNGFRVEKRNEVGFGIGNRPCPEFYPGNGFGINPGINSGINPGQIGQTEVGFTGEGSNREVGYGINSGTYPGTRPGFGSGVNPEIKPGINPEIYPGIGSGTNPGYGPWTGPGTNPGQIEGSVGFPGSVGGFGGEVGYGITPGNYPTGSGGFYPILNPNPNYPSVPNYSPNFPGWSNPQSECCSPLTPARISLIGTPGFPSLNFSPTPFECGYTISKFSANVCRLRLNLKFFNLGSEDPYCTNGHMEVDGRRICGCKSGVSLVIPFGNFPTKVINVRYVGLPRLKYNGFLIEVVQEVCGDHPLIRNRKDVSGVNETLSRKEDGVKNSSRSITSHARRKREGYWYSKPADHATLDTFSSEGRSERLFWNMCQNRVFLDWILAAKEAYVRGVKCPGLGNSGGVNSIIPNPEGWIGFPGRCEEIAAIEGVISSPFYPYYYPNNLRKCYRFYKSRGFCRLSVSILDFNLESNAGCTKDYLSFSGQSTRYCDNSLSGTTTVFDLSRTNVAEIYFVTDSSGSGRGFTAGFTQTLC